MSLLYDKVLNIINKPPDDRLDPEIDQILPWFTKKSDLFKSLHTDIVRDIIKNCNFVHTKRDAVIIRQMEKGDCFYIILSGSVAIHINTTLTEEEFETVLQTQLDEEAAFAKQKKEGRELDRSKYGIFVGKIDAGKSFGELALINTDCVRNASIIADEPTDLLMVDRDLYNRSLRAFQLSEFEERKDFVRNFPMFHNWAPRYRKMMAMSLKKQVMNFEDLIVKQGGTVDGIHFIIKGQVKLKVDPSQHSHQYEHLYPLGDIASLEKEKARELLRKEMNLERQRTQTKTSIYQKRTEFKKPSQKPLELCLAGAIDVIGDLEMAMGLTNYSQSVECTEESVIFHLDQRNYDRLIEKRNPGALEMLRDIVHTKLTLHFHRLQEDTIPLYRFFLYTLDEKEKDARRNASMPRSKTPAEMEATVENLQKGPLINMYGPGSVFYLIRKRAKEMKIRQRRRQNNPIFGSAPKPPAAMNAGYSPTKGLMTTAMANANNVYSQSTEYIDARPGSATGSMINLYGAGQDAQLIHAIEDIEYMDETGHVYDHVDGYDSGDFDFDDGTDWASSDSALCQLEERLMSWHSSLPTVQKGSCVVPLHRYQSEEENRPKPGNKVYVRLRTKPKNVSFFAFQEASDSSPSPDGLPPMKTSAQASRSPISSMPLLENITDSAIETMSETAERPLTTSRGSQRPKSTRSEPHGPGGHRQKKRKQYTVEEYQALKAELRRKQKAWMPLLPSRANTSLY